MRINEKGLAFCVPLGTALILIGLRCLAREEADDRVCEDRDAGDVGDRERGEGDELEGGHARTDCGWSHL